MQLIFTHRKIHVATHAQRDTKHQTAQKFRDTVRLIGAEQSPILVLCRYALEHDIDSLAWHRAAHGVVLHIATLRKFKPGLAVNFWT